MTMPPVQTFAVPTLTYDALVQVCTAADPAYRSHLEWAVTFRVYTMLRAMRDASGAPAMIGDTMHGYPVRLAGEVPHAAHIALDYNGEPYILLWC
jgi:HK97 family phage major capsid protein